MGEEKVSSPEWLTVDYIEKALQDGLNHPNLKIKNCDISPATSVGDNYASIMIRVRLVIQRNGKDEDFSMIVKLPLTGKFSESLKAMKVFEREINMYTKTLPAINNILKKAYPKKESLAAECYHTQEIPENMTCIFLEDLRQSGFTLANRFTCLDWDHTSLVLKSLAKLHASSLLYIEQNPDSLDLYDASEWSAEEIELNSGIFEAPVKFLAKNMPKWDDFPNKDLYHQKMKAIEGTIVDKVMNLFKKDDNKFNVICHGDVWINNMMFRYDKSNKVNGLRFLDFQVSYYNTPALDLNYFIFTSAQTRFTDIDSLLEVYYEAFMETLKSLKYELIKPFTLDILKQDFRDSLFFGLAVVLGIVPITTVPASKAVSADDMLDKDSSEYDKMYDRQEFTDILKEAFPFFEKAGVF